MFAHKINIRYVHQELKTCHSRHPGLDPGPGIQGDTGDFWTLDRPGPGSSPGPA